MFEYINPGFYLLSGLIVLGLFVLMIITAGKEINEGKKLSIPYVPMIIIIVSIGLPIQSGISTRDTINTNIQFFQGEELLKCSTFGSSYLVSKENGWVLFDDGFTKESILIRADNCKRVEK